MPEVKDTPVATPTTLHGSDATKPGYVSKSAALTFLNVEDGATADQTAQEIATAIDADATAEATLQASLVTTTAVTTAGALMDSEVDADIKTLSLPASTTISAFGATLVDDANAAAARTTLELGTAATSATGDFAAASHTHTVSEVTDFDPATKLDVASPSMTGDLVVAERADHASTPTAGCGYLWVRSDTPNVLV